VTRRPRIHRGLTFLEVVAAVALLGVVAASLLGLLAFLGGSQSREAQQLAAAELANRLVLMYLDDPTAMPPGRDPIAYGPAQYRFEYREEPLQLEEAKPEGRTATRTQSPLSNARFVQLTVRVWLSERSGGSREPGAGAPGATLTRIMDPIAMRNPDSVANIMSDPARMQEYVRRMGGFMSPAPTGGGGAERSNR
jgi:hypothetical protein